ncbi:hypothetical protein I6N90_08200 [Paenibacillus sp. GSMTC-2017]|nr:hypothetical protein [Paenibacillus sp. GSMTC-2017]
MLLVFLFCFLGADPSVTVGALVASRLACKAVIKSITFERPSDVGAETISILSPAIFCSIRLVKANR